MSSRKGNVVFFMDVLEEAERRVLAVIAEKNPDLPHDQRGRRRPPGRTGRPGLRPALGGQYQGHRLRLDSALSFDGQTAPYIQNAHVRANSILRKAGACRRSRRSTTRSTEHGDRADRLDLALPGRGAAGGRRVQAAAHGQLRVRAGPRLPRLLPRRAGAAGRGPARRLPRLRLVAAARQTLANALRLLAIARAGRDVVRRMPSTRHPCRILKADGTRL